MSSPLSSARQSQIKAAMLGALWLAACGGSAIESPGSGAAGGAVNTGGSLHSAGSTNSAGSSHSAGAPNSGGSGGSTSAGSGGMCGPCLAIGCGPGFKSVLEPGACCPSCVPDGSGGVGGSCAGVDCPDYACAPGYQLQQQPGSCCPTCVSNDACAAGKRSYDELKMTLLAEPGAASCKTNSDCSVLWGNPYCGEACTYEPINLEAAMAYDSLLTQYGQMVCSSCMQTYPHCPASPPPACFNGRCAFVQF